LDNRNKRGMSLDLKSAHARTVVERLVKWADVLVINFPHPARKRLKLTYEEVAAWNPRLIYADITGYGDNGPDADLPGFDITAFWARTGLLSLTRDSGAPPTLPLPAAEITLRQSGCMERLLPPSTGASAREKARPSPLPACAGSLVRFDVRSGGTRRSELLSSALIARIRRMRFSMSTELRTTSGS